MIYIRATFVYCEFSGSGNKMYNNVLSLKAKPGRTVPDQRYVIAHCARCTKPGFNDGANPHISPVFCGRARCCVSDAQFTIVPTVF